MSAPGIKWSTKLKVEIMVDGQVKEVTVSYDELKFVFELGIGGYGLVRKMLHTSGHYFAVKSPLRNDALAMDFYAHQSLGNDCPYIVEFYGALEESEQGVIHFLTEGMDMDLGRFYTEYEKIPFALQIPIPLPEWLLSKTAYAVLNAIEYMEKRQIMHRDIKPSNILINTKGDIKVCDFGVMGKMVNSMCNTPGKGTPLYMPPEKVSRKSPTNGYSIKADTWSLGISLIEMATGSHPFKSLFAVLAGEPPKLDPDTFSPEFCTFVRKCLIKEAEKRSSCAELLEEKFVTKYIDKPPDLELIEKVIGPMTNDKTMA